MRAHAKQEFFVFIVVSHALDPLVYEGNTVQFYLSLVSKKQTVD